MGFFQILMFWNGTPWLRSSLTYLKYGMRRRFPRRRRLTILSFCDKNF
jgi:hypothetical protein